MNYKIAAVPGDGVGKEVVSEGMRVLDAVSDLEGFSLSWNKFDFGSERYLKTGETLTEEDLKEVAKNDSIYLGALGDPRVKPGVLEGGILLKLRFYFDQYVNLRPVKLMPGVKTPLRDKTSEDIDFIVVRENTEDFYVGAGNSAKSGKSKQEIEIKRELYNIKFGLDLDVDGDEIAYQIGVVSRKGCERIIRYAFELAKKKDRKKVTSVDKANVLSDIYGLWREVFSEVAAGYPNIDTEFNFVDAITMYFVSKPEWFDVVVTPNMFGDIITDLGAQIQGGIGLAPSGNINPKSISMFEPVHGSAPDIAGKNICNPIATVWAGAMMLDTLGEENAAMRVENAIADVLESGECRTRDIGGEASCTDMSNTIIKRL
jgi:tartrate dehydrogenase/decarboxylase / D-malate dehydrogenase